MATVSLYEELLALFRRFADQGAKETSDLTVLQLWRKTLGTEDYIILRTLAQLRIALKRATEQISDTRILDPEDKNAATLAMNALDGLINPDLLHKSYSEVAEHVSRAKIVMLRLLASSLKEDFPEATVAREDVVKFVGDVAEIEQVVRGFNNLDTLFKTRILGYIKDMNWCVSNMEITGVEAIYTTFGPPLLFLRKEFSQQTDDDGFREPTKLVHQLIEDLFERIVNKIGD
ncbi:MAG TPA: hypothetical protein VHY35_00415 [Stellaceae bacterium]|jgi:hypothetical protein|nr:hypothetical protein [Stellaceae bacterium]